MSRIVILEMDTKVADIMTDSDSSSSSNSWVFVDEHNISDMNAPNQFYLNCSGEPVQELTENDLGKVLFVYYKEHYCLITRIQNIYISISNIKYLFRSNNDLFL